MVLQVLEENDCFLDEWNTAAGFWEKHEKASLFF